jgi:hypothetical protein
MLFGLQRLVDFFLKTILLLVTTTTHNLDLPPGVKRKKKKTSQSQAMSPSAVPSTTPPPAAAAAAAATNGKTPADHVTSSPSPTSASSSLLIPAWVQPDLTRLLRVEHNPGSFTSRSISLVNLPAGAIFARITNATPAAAVAYSSVQATRDLHIELNCDLLYVNHSCKPSLVFDMEKWEVRVSDELEGGLKAGDELTFFYPSTEWSMAQPFECLCKTDVCKGVISGARDMDEEMLRGYWLNGHIEELLAERKGR